MTTHEEFREFGRKMDALKLAIRQAVRRDYVRLRNRWMKFTDLFRRDKWRSRYKSD